MKEEIYFRVLMHIVDLSRPGFNGKSSQCDPPCLNLKVFRPNPFAFDLLEQQEH